MIEVNNTTKSRIDLRLVKRVTAEFLKVHKKSSLDVSIAFIGDQAMRRLNKTYRGKDKPTDILTFDGEQDFLGEIIIDYAQIKRQAKLYSSSIKEELVFILVHGLLHLLGHEDDTEAGRLKMISLGETFIKNKL